MNENVAIGLASHIWFKKFLHAIWLPLIIILSSSIGYAAYRYYYLPLNPNAYSSQIMSAAFIGLQIISGISTYWFFTRLINNLTHYLLSTSILLHHKKIAILLPFFKSLIKTIALLAFVNLVVPYLGLPAGCELFLEKFSSVLIICGISWLLLRFIHVFEQLIFNGYFLEAESTQTTNKLYTQILILKRIAISIILILTLGSILMLFENVRSLGTSVLTTAGIVSLLLTFTAQRSLPSILASVEIAMTQPIKIGDSVLIENQFGVIEKINLRYVVVKLWDWRRLVLPTTYFLEKPFENWSKEDSANLIGTVFLYVDYTLPVSALREEFVKILERSTLWDGQVNTIQVSNCSEHTMELRILASAKTPSDTWNLSCEIREKLIAFIAAYHPSCLPISRQIKYPENYGYLQMKKVKETTEKI